MRDDHAPRLQGVLDQLMGACDLIQRHSFGDVQPVITENSVRISTGILVAR
jgi:hypothetical protein